MVRKTQGETDERHRGHSPVILDPAGPSIPSALWYEPHGSLSEAAVVATDERFCWRPAEPLISSRL